MTLVEVLAAALLLSIIVTSVLQLYTQSWTVSARDGERMVAAHLAQLTLEEWLAVHDYRDVKAKMADHPIRTLDNDDVLRDIWDEMLPGMWKEVTFYETYTPVVELAHALPGRSDGPIRVTVTISGRHHQSVTLHGVKDEPVP
nr:hypothetical protein [Bacillota bacterium]